MTKQATLEVDKETLSRVLVTDCGSTTTKALYFEKTDAGWTQSFRGEAPTTVEAPVEDVTVGVRNACTEIQEVSGRRIFSEQAAEADPPFLLQKSGDDGIDVYLSTSSAGGGLQMIVAGVVREMTAESAERAALGAGAIVLDTLSADDGREDHEKIERIRHLKPDIVLLTGGVDGGSSSHVIELAEMLLAASPRPRFGNTLKLPVIYAGNKDAAPEVQEILAELATLHCVENVRPTLEEENLGPAREAIHEFFLAHVMSHSPGYGKLLSWSPVPIMPTPAAVGDIVQTFAQKQSKQTLCVDIGGATTDVFSMLRNQKNEWVFNRTVSANLGMSYSVANVLLEAGEHNIRRWLPDEIPLAEMRNRLRNKMIRPTSIPQALEDLWLEQAVCREALRLSLVHHKSLAVGLSGMQQSRGIADIFSQKSNRYELVDMLALDVVIGSGGVLSHAPNRNAAALMMLEGFGLEGVTEIDVDSIFMMPHLGVLASIHPEAAAEIFEKDCVVRVAHSIVPVWPERKKPPKKLATVFLDAKEVSTVEYGKVHMLELEEGREYHLRVEPAARYISVTTQPGEPWEDTIIAGQSGLLLDGRGRPLMTATLTADERQATYRALGLLTQGGD